MTRIPIRVPDLGMETEEMKFGAWLKQPGDPVNAGEDLFEIEADKATVVCEALDGGTLAETTVTVTGQELKQGDVLGWIDTSTA
jgi:pyruvate/2-oxoglutarate dehydrogenase complex dihydrolipoamide acyltransferase (E2) component